MMLVDITISCALTLPDGSASVDGEGGRAWILPDGQMIKPWVVLELNDERDLSFAEAGAMGLDVVDTVEDVTIVEEFPA